MYTLLYNSMVSWYRKSYGKSNLADWAAVLVLSVMAFLNIGSIIALGAYFRWNVAMKVIANGSPTGATLLAILLLLIHLRLLPKKRPGLRAPDAQSADTRPSKWPAGAYMLASVGCLLFASSLYSSHAQN